MRTWAIHGNGNAKKGGAKGTAYWQQGTNKGTMAPPTLHNMQKQLNQMAVLLGNNGGVAKGQDKGKGKNGAKGKGKSNGKGKGNAWDYKAYSPNGTQVLAIDPTRAFYGGQQDCLDAEIAKRKGGMLPLSKAIPTQELRRELLAEQPVMEVDTSQEAKDAAVAAKGALALKTQTLLGLVPLPSTTLLDQLYPVPRVSGPRKSAVVMANEKVSGGNNGNLETAMALLEGCKASVMHHKNSKTAGLKEGLKKEEELAQAAVDKINASTPNTITTRARIADALDALAPAETQRASAAAELMENANRLHAQSLEAVDAQMQGLVLMRGQLVDHQKRSQDLWQKRNEMLKTEAEQLKEELQNMLKQVNVEAQPASTTAPAGALVDLSRDFAVSLEDLPALPSQPNDTYMEQLASLHFFYTNVGDFGRVPPTTFEGMQVSTGVIHNMLGDCIWEGFWEKENSKNIAKSQYIPTTMHDMLRTMIRPKREQLAAMAGMEPAKVRYEASKQLAERVTLGYSAY